MTPPPLLIILIIKGIKHASKINITSWFSFFLLRYFYCGFFNYLRLFLGFFLLGRLKSLRLLAAKLSNLPVILTLVKKVIKNSISL